VIRKEPVTTPERSRRKARLGAYVGAVSQLGSDGSFGRSGTWLAVGVQALEASCGQPVHGDAGPDAVR
jgi:hypothetical protein